MPINNDGIMVILSSPSGAGKTTLVNLLSKLDNFEVSISHTTRQPRPSEVPDKDYYFINEEECHGVKMEGGVLTKAIREIEISCLASNIPESIDVDVLELKLNDSIRLTELSLGEGVEIPNLDESNDQMVVNVITPKEIVEEEPIIEDEAEGEDASTDEGESASEDAPAESEDSAEETSAE